MSISRRGALGALLGAPVAGRRIVEEAIQQVDRSLALEASSLRRRNRRMQEEEAVAIKTGGRRTSQRRRADMILSRLQQDLWDDMGAAGRRGYGPAGLFPHHIGTKRSWSPAFMESVLMQEERARQRRVSALQIVMNRDNGVSTEGRLRLLRRMGLDTTGLDEIFELLDEEPEREVHLGADAVTTRPW